MPKYFKRIGTPGHYKYFYTKEEYDKNKKNNDNDSIILNKYWKVAKYKNNKYHIIDHEGLHSMGGLFDSKDDAVNWYREMFKDIHKPKDKQKLKNPDNNVQYKMAHKLGKIRRMETIAKNGNVYVAFDKDGNIDFDKSGVVYKGKYHDKTVYFIGGDDSIKAQSYIRQNFKGLSLTPDKFIELGKEFGKYDKTLNRFTNFK